MAGAGEGAEGHTGVCPVKRSWEPVSQLGQGNTGCAFSKVLRGCWTFGEGISGVPDRIQKKPVTEVLAWGGGGGGGRGSGCVEATVKERVSTPCFHL